MVTLVLKDQKIAELFHKALVGTPEYINSKIVISEVDNGEYELIVGEENENNLRVRIDSVD